MRTYIQGEEEKVCPCNYHLTPVIVDVDNMTIKCSICRHTEAFPEYALALPHDAIKDYYVHPLREYVQASSETRQPIAIAEILKNSFWSTIRL